jgi:hypothetical protein
MGPHVRGNGGALRELAVADFAAKWLLARMGSQMGCQVCRLCEGLVALVAFVGLLARMGSHVGLEGARPGIGLIADAATIHAVV